MRWRMAQMGIGVACAVLCLSVPAYAAPSFDCAKASSLIEKTICAEPALAEADKRLSSTYEADLSALSVDGRASLQDGQRQWLKMTRTVCNITAAPAHAYDPTEKGCLKGKYAERQGQLETAVKSVGGIKFRRVDVIRIRHTSTKDDDTGSNSGFVTLEEAYPQIDVPRTAAERAFNQKMEALAKKQAEADDDDDSDQYLGFQTISVSPRLISVDISRGFYAHGTPHGQSQGVTIHWLVPEGRELRADDVFPANTRWNQFLREYCFGNVRSYGVVKSADQLDNSPSDPEHWWFNREGLVVTFDSYEVASYADGEPSVTIPWAALKRYVKSNAPIPFPRYDVETWQLR